MFHTALTRRYPVATFTNRRDPLFELVERVLDRDTSAANEAVESASWVPPVDLLETDAAFIFTAELPGLTKKDLDISLDDNLLTVSGERTFTKAGENDNYHRVERAYGTFRRAFSLPTGVDATKVAAKFKDGLLTLSVPKNESAKPRKIAIN